MPGTLPVNCAEEEEEEEWEGWAASISIDPLAPDTATPLAEASQAAAPLAASPLTVGHVLANNTADTVSSSPPLLTTSELEQLVVQQRARIAQLALDNSEILWQMADLRAQIEAACGRGI